MKIKAANSNILFSLLDVVTGFHRRDLSSMSPDMKYCVTKLLDAYSEKLQNNEEVD
jgi:hypothetical protein